MRGWWQDLTDLVLPADCAGCGGPRVALCAGCRAALCGAAPRRVRPDPEPRGLPAVYAAAAYGQAVRAVLLAHKERGALPLAGALGEALAGAVLTALRAAAADGVVDGAVGRAVGGAEPGIWPGRGSGRVLGGPVLLVPVPSARRSVRARGHDPVRRIALAAAGELRRAGMPVSVLSALRQRRAVADQAGLNSRQRQANLSGALEVVAGAGPLLRDAGRIVVVDDLMTTGASLAEAARALGGVCGAHGVGDRAGGEGDATARGIGGAGRGSGFGGSSGSEGSGEGRGSGESGRTGRRAQVTAGRQAGNRPSWEGGDGVAKVAGKGCPASGMPRLNIIRAAVVATSAASFEINRN
ncbi:ComF family protein [Streptomyces flavofungini]|uniref:ComF family protein n=1 Tax=Streptomyces flavofungini TaxID=68200 RepID=UPI0025AFBE93|nr:ComF family protein [Streptomyces flavofungini]WJV48341.1 ComF family protein [Streptomyces flavofungini]